MHELAILSTVGPLSKRLDWRPETGRREKMLKPVSTIPALLATHTFQLFTLIVGKNNIDLGVLLSTQHDHIRLKVTLRTCNPAHFCFGKCATQRGQVHG